MPSAKDTLINLLKQQGHSVTQARLLVFDALVDQEPMSMHQLIERVGNIDRASIYRAIDLFERLNIVQRLNTGWKYKIELTDKFADHHHHVTCMSCGKTVAMNEQSLERFIDQVARTHGYKPLTHQVEIQGLCANCQNTEPKKQAPERP